MTELRQITGKALLLSLLVLCSLSLCENSLPLLDIMSPKEFRELAEELSPKVNLFAETWELHPQVEFFGGTTRDYLYWLKGQFKTARTEQDVQKIKTLLRKRKVIDVREFIIGDSDVDIVSDEKTLSIKANDYGVRKIDVISRDLFNPKTELGRNEIEQGYVPVEKIRLAKNGFRNANGFGNGLEEILQGMPSIHFSAEEHFQQSLYAKQKENHPVLMALRFLRVLAINYYQNHGDEYPEPKILFDMDPEIELTLRQVFTQAAEDGELEPFLRQPRFVTWINQIIQKGFRSYTNPTAAKMLYDHFGVSDLVDAYPEKIQPYNQYVFQRHPDPERYQSHMKHYGVDETKFIIPTLEIFPELSFFHGTKTPENFRAILFQGILPSDQGSAGAGLYGVRKSNLNFAINWGNDENRVVVFRLEPEARVVDFRNSYVKGIYQRYVEDHPQADIDDFCEAFGIDILQYEYSSEAFVVKNSAVLSRPQGHKVQLLTLPKLRAMAKSVQTSEEILGFLEILHMNSVNERELYTLAKTLVPKIKKSDPILAKIPPADSVALPRLLETPQALIELAHRRAFADATEALGAQIAMAIPLLKSARQLRECYLRARDLNFTPSLTLPLIQRLVQETEHLDSGGSIRVFLEQFPPFEGSDLIHPYAQRLVDLLSGKLVSLAQGNPTNEFYEDFHLACLKLKVPELVRDTLISFHQKQITHIRSIDGIKRYIEQYKLGDEIKIFRPLFKALVAQTHLLAKRTSSYAQTRLYWFTLNELERPLGLINYDPFISRFTETLAGIDNLMEMRRFFKEVEPGNFLTPRPYAFEQREMTHSKMDPSMGTVATYKDASFTIREKLTEKLHLLGESAQSNRDVRIYWELCSSLGESLNIKSPGATFHMKLNARLQNLIAGLSSLDEVESFISLAYTQVGREWHPARKALFRQLEGLAATVNSPSEFTRYTELIKTLNPSNTGLEENWYLEIMESLSKRSSNEKVRSAALLMVEALKEESGQSVDPNHPWLESILHALRLPDNAVHVFRGEGSLIRDTLAPLAFQNHPLFLKIFHDLANYNNPKTYSLAHNALLPAIRSRLVDKMKTDLPPALREDPPNAELVVSLALKQMAYQPRGEQSAESLLSPPKPRQDLHWHPLKGIVRYLIYVFSSGEEIAPEHLDYIRSVIGVFDPDLPMDKYLRNWLESNGPKMITSALDMERAHQELENLGLKQKFLQLSDPNVGNSLGYWMKRPPLVSMETASANAKPGSTAGEKGLRKVYCYVEGPSVFHGILRSPDGRPNILLPEGSPFDNPPFGDVLYTHSHTEISVRHQNSMLLELWVDPSAQEGVDFFRGRGEHYLWKNRSKLRVLSINPDHLLAIVGEFSSARPVIAETAAVLTRSPSDPCLKNFSHLEPKE